MVDTDVEMETLTDWYFAHVRQYIQSLDAVEYGTILEMMERVKFKYIEMYRRSIIAMRATDAKATEILDAELVFKGSLCEMLGDNLFIVQKYVPNCISVQINSPHKTDLS